MSEIKRPLIICVLLVHILFSSGCWDYEENNKLALIAGFAIDKDEKSNKYIVTVEIIKPALKGNETDIQRSLFFAQGDTIFEAIRNLIPVVSKRSYWAHAKVAVISQKIAEEDIVAVIDLMNRDPELRADINLIISKEKTAMEILHYEPKLGQLISFELDDAIKSQRSLSEVPKGEVWNFVKDLSSNSTSAVLPTVKAKECAKGKFSPEVIGSAIFKGKIMVGSMDGIDTRAMLWLRGDVKQTVVAINALNSNDTKITMELFNTKTKLNPVYKDGKLTMDVNIEASMNIGEVEGYFEYSDEADQEKIKDTASSVIREQIEEVIKKAKEEYRADVFGFGQAIERKYPDIWDNIKDDWEVKFTELEIQINIKINIIGSALMSEPIKVGK